MKAYVIQGREAGFPLLLIRDWDIEPLNHVLVDVG